ncbi:MAG: hypothetical protein COT15_03735 [Candidatus Diapherotrites archaeon CG08_land_8_20_14_0_20_34_12]|nr:MAG: hypothetical protein COT15_03735 [Candidatus Diapherotrites archaeon CG08_land_8_20_14_0_20_34_12]
MNFPNVSIIIAAHNNANILKKVLDAMLKLDYPKEYEIIVINDGSKDETKKMLNQNFGKNPKITIINLEKNQGVCKARNTAIKIAKNNIVVNMDHDCIPEKNWLKDLMLGFDSEKVGAVTSYGGYGGTSTAFRKNLLDKVKGYDEDYGYYREDTDLTFKIIELGYEFKQVKANYVHDHGETKPKGIFGLIKYVINRWKYHMNDVLLYKKHTNKLTKDFLDIKFGFLVNPLKDISLATGTWKAGEKLKLSSPRGITFLENKTPIHTIIILLVGIGYMLGLKFFRAIASIKYGKLLI